MWKWRIFDQLRSQLDESKSILDNIGQGRDVITINGRSRNSWAILKDFLFTRERARAHISALSGGERNRLLLARLFTQPANLLILDEPTNDLDIETSKSSKTCSSNTMARTARQSRLRLSQQHRHQHFYFG